MFVSGGIMSNTGTSDQRKIMSLPKADGVSKDWLSLFLRGVWAEFFSVLSPFSMGVDDLEEFMYQIYKEFDITRAEQIHGSLPENCWANLVRNIVRSVEIGSRIRSRELLRLFKTKDLKVPTERLYMTWDVLIKKFPQTYSKVLCPDGQCTFRWKEKIDGDNIIITRELFYHIRSWLSADEGWLSADEVFAQHKNILKREITGEELFSETFSESSETFSLFTETSSET